MFCRTNCCFTPRRRGFFAFVRWLCVRSKSKFAHWKTPRKVKELTNYSPLKWLTSEYYTCVNAGGRQRRPSAIFWQTTCEYLQRARFFTSFRIVLVLEQSERTNGKTDREIPDYFLTREFCQICELPILKIVNIAGVRTK